MTVRSSIFMAAILAASLGVVGCDDNNNNNNPNSPGTTASPSPTPSASPSASPSAEPSASPSPNNGNNGGNNGNAGNEFSFTGTVKRTGNDQIKVGGIFVTEAPGSRVNLGQYQMGEFLRVHGILQADGSVQATRITRQ